MCVGLSHALEDMTLLPPGLDHLKDTDRGIAWLRALPGVVERCASRWGLRLGAPYDYAYASLAVRCTTPQADDCVLKIQFPDRESEREAEALAHWDGDGAVRLLAHDPEASALLLERCVPGTPLSAADPDEALDVVVGLLPRLWKPAGEPFLPLTEEAQWWLQGLEGTWDRAGRPFERALLDEALEVLRTLPHSQGEQVLVNQDLHVDNVLRAQREPWLLIDPKPLAAEREFGIVAVVRGAELGHSREAVRHRLDRLTDELGLDRERVRLWTLAHTIAWGFEGDQVLEPFIEIARWLRR